MRNFAVLETIGFIVVSFDELVARRGVLQVLRQLEVERLVNLDHIARIAAQATDRHAAAVSVRYGDDVAFIGAYNFSAKRFRRVLTPPVEKGGVLEIENFSSQFELANRNAKLPLEIRALAVAFIWIGNEVVGSIAVMEQSRCRPLTERQKKLMLNLADYCAVQIERRARLAMVAYNLQSESLTT